MYALYDLLFIRFMRPNWTEDLRIYHRETMAIPIPMHIVMRKDTNYTILVRPGHYFPFAEAHCQCKHCSRKCQNIKRNNNINLTSAARSVRWLGGVKGGGGAFGEVRNGDRKTPLICSHANLLAQFAKQIFDLVSVPGQIVMHERGVCSIV